MHAGPGSTINPVAKLRVAPFREKVLEVRDMTRNIPSSHSPRRVMKPATWRPGRLVFLIMLLLFASTAIEAQAALAPGTRVTVDINLVTPPGQGNWQTGTLTAYDPSARGYWVRLDDGTDKLIPKRDPDLWIRAAAPAGAMAPAPARAGAAPPAAAAQDPGAGSSVMVDINMVYPPGQGNWQHGTVISYDESARGYWVRMDNGDVKMIPKRQPDLWIRSAPPQPAPQAESAPARPASQPGATSASTPARPGKPAMDPRRVLTPPAAPASQPKPGKVTLEPGLPPAAPALTAKGPVGLYFMTRFNQTTGSLERKVWYFSPEGMAYEDPKDGFSADALASLANRYGSFQLTGDQMAVQMVKGHPLVGRYEPKAGGMFSWDSKVFKPVQALERSRIVGVWQGSYGTRDATATRTLRLNADGTYHLSGGLIVGREGDEGDRDGTAGDISRGLWGVDGNFITLIGTSRSYRSIAFPWEAGQFYFDGIIWSPLK